MKTRRAVKLQGAKFPVGIESKKLQVGIMCFEFFGFLESLSPQLMFSARTGKTNDGLNFISFKTGNGLINGFIDRLLLFAH